MCNWVERVAMLEVKEMKGSMKQGDLVGLVQGGGLTLQELHVESVNSCLSLVDNAITGPPDCEEYE